MEKNMFMPDITLITKMVPTVNILINNNKVKNYNGKYYLKNNTEFSILFENKNPNKVSCLISINGIEQKSTLVLLPYSTVCLDRYIDENKKFIFNTYNVDNNEAVKEIIKNNGVFEFKFYYEELPCNFNYYNNILSGGYRVNNISNEPLYNTTYSSHTYCSTNNYLSISSTMNIPEQIETGRIEKGDISSQSFNYDYTKFNPNYFSTVKFELLPESKLPKTKPQVIYKHRSYCNQCGRRMKFSWKFCPICGINS